MKLKENDIVKYTFPLNNKKEICKVVYISLRQLVLRSVRGLIFINLEKMTPIIVRQKNGLGGKNV